MQTKKTKQPTKQENIASGGGWYTSVMHFFWCNASWHQLH